MILITGGSGFLGKCVVSKLLSKKLPVRVFYHTKKTGIFYGDVTDSSAVRKAMKGVDAVIHLVSPNTGSRKINEEVNVDGTRVVVDACKESGVKRLIFLSSWAVLRKNKDWYAITKKKAESVLRKSGLNYTILRPTMIYGKGGYAFGKLVQTTKLPIVPILGKGTQLIGPVFVEDVADIIIKCMYSKKTYKKTYSIVGPLMQYEEFVKLILALQGKRKFLLHIPLNIAIAFAKFFNIFIKSNFNEQNLRRIAENVYQGNDIFSRDIHHKLIDLKEGLRKSLQIHL